MVVTYRRGRVPRDVRFAVVTVLAAVVVAAVFSFFGIIGVGMFGWKLAFIALAAFAVGYVVDILRTLYPQLPQVTANAQDEDGRRIYEAVKAACDSAHVPAPRVYLDPDEEANAFTYGFGQRHSVIVFQKGIITLAGDDEAILRAVAAHEVGHMLSFDCAIFTALIFPIHVMTWLAHLLQVLARALSGLVRPIVYIARFSGDIWGFLIGLAIALMVLGAVFYLFMGGAFILAAVALCMLFVNLLKREREYAADAIGARLTGDRPGFVELLRLLLDVAPREKDVLIGALAGSPGPKPEGDELPDLQRWPRDRYVKIGLRNAVRELWLDHPYVVRRLGNLNSAGRLGRPLVRSGDMTAWVLAGLLVVLAPFGVAHGMISVGGSAARGSAGSKGMTDEQRAAEATRRAERMVGGVTGTDLHRTAPRAPRQPSAANPEPESSRADGVRRARGLTDAMGLSSSSGETMQRALAARRAWEQVLSGDPGNAEAWDRIGEIDQIVAAAGSDTGQSSPDTAGASSAGAWPSAPGSSPTRSGRVGRRASQPESQTFADASGGGAGQPRSRKPQRSRSRWGEPTSEPRQATGMRGRRPRSQQQEPDRVQKPEQPRFQLPMEETPNPRQSPRRSAPEAAPPRERETPRFAEIPEPPVPTPPPPPPKTKLMLALEKVSERPEVGGCVEKLWQPDSEVSLVYASFDPGLSYSAMKKIVCTMVEEAQDAAGSDELCLVADQRSREIMRGQWRSVSGKVIITDLR